MDRYVYKIEFDLVKKEDSQPLQNYTNISKIYEKNKKMKGLFVCIPM